MLAGTVYFYDEAMGILKEMDLEDYEVLTEAEFLQLIQKWNAVKVTLETFSHNHHNGIETALYNKNKIQT